MPPTAVLDRPALPVLTVIEPAQMGVFYNVCDICKRPFRSGSPSNDCGADDAQHRAARGQ